MIKRSRGKMKSFVTKTVTADVIGGEEDYCEYSCGYKRTENGLEQFYSTEPSGFTFTQKSGNWARYIEKIGQHVITSTQGNIYVWDGVANEKRGLGSLLTGTPGVFTADTEGTGNYYVYGKDWYIVLKPDGTNTRLRVLYSAYCGVVNAGRFFYRDLSDGLLVRWTGDVVGEMYDGLDRGGWLRVVSDGGDVENMLRTDDGIVLLRQYGATMLYALHDPRHFRVGPTAVFDLGTPIFCLASALLGGKVYFAADDKLYYLEGLHPKEIKLVNYMRGCVINRVEPYGGRYLYLSFKKDGERYFAEYDSVTGGVTVFGKGCYVCWHAKDKFYCFDKDNVIVCLTLGADGGREWRSRPFGFRGKGLCTLKSVTAELEGSAEVGVSAGGVTRKISSGGNTCIGLTGSEFVFSVTGTGGVRKLTAEWEVRE